MLVRPIREGNCNVRMGWVSQTESFLNDKLTDLVTSLTIIDNDADLSDITLRTENPAYDLQPGDYLQLNRVLNRLENILQAISQSISY
ncbi:hypothetical protein [Paenibacillus planticolens]|uniref:hypothetical protein n=1 Tax=Paenibacillus planticolens TaxID=2654976 RepID=UPI001491446D|nr:hypothetical protein [Paenibacillus planticolens]